MCYLRDEIINVTKQTLNLEEKRIIHFNKVTRNKNVHT
jgi:hypothetical protein